MESASAPDYLGWIFLGTISFVVLSILYEAVRQVVRRWRPRQKKHLEEESQKSGKNR